MRRRSMHENREIPPAPAAEGLAGRPEKASGRTSGMYAGGKSDSPIVPMKPPNKGDAEVSPAEEVEERGLTKGNTQQSATPRTQGRAGVSNGLLRVREAAGRDRYPYPSVRFYATYPR